MEIKIATQLLDTGGIGFEVVYEGDEARCPVCVERETRKAA
jgi:hypothetical protein